MSKNPNIVFFFSDQQRQDTIGCYGQKLEVTPNLDRMASEGVIFKNAFTCQPLCGPARACLQTGRYATETGCFMNNIALPSNEKTIAHYLSEAGYEVGYIGKWHLASQGSEFNFKKKGVPTERRGGYKDYWAAADVLEATSHGYDGFLFDADMHRVDFKGYRADCITDYVLEYLRTRNGEKPFFLFISYIEPHQQNDHNQYEGPIGSREKFKDFEAPSDLLGLKGDWRENYPDYLGCCNSLDRNLGRIRSQLEESGFSDNTVVFYTCDHASHFKTRIGEYKRTCHENSVRIPMIAWGPGFKGGKVIDNELVSLINLPATILACAGIDKPETMRGRPLQELLNGKAADWPQEVFVQMSGAQVGRAIRTKKWKYSVRAYDKNAKLDPGSDTYTEDCLYDLAKDPNERNNLVSDPYYAEVRAELSEILKKHMREAGEEIPVILPNEFSEVRLRESFDLDWKFVLGDMEEAKNPDFDDSGWRKLHLPHDWSIEGEYREENPTGKRGGFLPVGTGWYRKTFDMPGNLERRKVFVDFDGIYMNSDVWINGNHLGYRPFGYIGFEYDITDYIKQGLNVIAVRVDTSKAPSNRWYTGSGIYCHTWLTITRDVHLDHWGTYITTPDVCEKEAAVSISAVIKNESNVSRKISVVSEIYKKKSEAKLKKAMPEISASAEITLPPLSCREIKQEAIINDPLLWSPDSPELYLCKNMLYENGSIIDSYITDFGIRYFNFDSQNGFTLNGMPLKFKGVCHHHDAGPVGAAVPDKLLENRIIQLKEMGCNAIRTAHKPLVPEFYDMCDRLGIMVMDEAFDGWETVKADFDYGLYFEEWWEKDLGDMLKRDRNHPCIILWSIGNEVKNMKPETTIKLVEFIHNNEPTRPVTCGVMQVDKKSDENRELLDVAGYNEGGGACFIYEKDHINHPKRKFIATEAPHTFQTRGFYRTQTWWRDKDQERIEIENLTEEEIFFDGAVQYNSSYDNSGVRVSARDSWKIALNHPYLCGEFRWTGFDYLGESFGWPARMANFGVIDLCGFPKDHYYLYQSLWTEKPMVHLLPHWTHHGMEGTVIPVWVYTNCGSAELFLNGKSLGRKNMGEEMYLSWDVPYVPGTLKAVAFKDGAAAAEKSVKTASDPYKINLRSDNEDITPDGRDIAQIVFEIVDKEGNQVPSADDTLVFNIDGPAVNIGLDNGDPLDLTPHRVNFRKVFNALGKGIFQSTFHGGDIEVTAAGILGNHIFKEIANVSIAVSSTVLRGTPVEREYTVAYTLDGTEPDKDGQIYRKPFTINDSCLIKAAIYRGKEKIIDLESEFIKGEREKVIDLTHGNRKEAKENRFAGPFANELMGEWTCGEDTYVFEKNGFFSIKKAGGSVKAMGQWWYDYPQDPFEAPDYAGKGELLWNDGRLTLLSLENQSGKVLNMKDEMQTSVLLKKYIEIGDKM